MNNTPRTDAVLNEYATIARQHEALANLCRELERSLSEEIQAGGALANAVGEAFDKGLDNDKLRAALSAWAQRETPK